ncbi:hypothetical protein Cgig2_033578 [Carnegiea gigantea]|uniref:Cytochrome P450 n=1 Tax=Carnegiea gigantea TaxID=171969 RepID=A0A9Q1KQC8_9CARY|nr:hypothetical protein Cgig2_033578 [Carnegiea gigantea]
MYTYIEIFVVLFSLVFLFCYSFHKKRGPWNNWPLIGVLPALLKNHHRIHDIIVEVMEKGSLTFVMKGPRFTNMKLLITADPANAQHILSKNFGNYPKGSKFKDIVEILGDGIFNVDSEMWKYHRKMAQFLLSHPQFKQFWVEKIWKKIETGLIPILDHVAKQGLEIELQDLFGRFTFDTISTVVLDYDPRTLCFDLPNFPVSKALHDGEEAIFYRHVVPACVWKFQKWLGIGTEKKYREASKIVDNFIYGCISRKREEMRKNSQSNACKVGPKLGVDLMTLYMDEIRDSGEIGSNPDKFLRDTVLSYFVAGKETTSAALCWFLYLLSKNPHVLAKIKEELDVSMAQAKDHHGDEKIIWDRYDILSRKFKEVGDKLIYFHAAICEALRLYPTVPFNAKTPIKPDTLPSGHKVDSSTQIIFSMYALGRMKSLWGEDSYEFKPERWILETRKFRYVPSYQFLAFNSGPRTCLGKNMSMTIMKAAVIAIISKYHIQPVRGHPIVPDVSLILHMRHGLKAQFVKDKGVLVVSNGFAELVARAVAVPAEPVAPIVLAVEPVEPVAQNLTGPIDSKSLPMSTGPLDNTCPQTPVALDPANPMCPSLGPPCSTNFLSRPTADTPSNWADSFYRWTVLS